MHQNADGIGAGFTEPLRKKAEEQGAEFMFDTQVTRLLTNADGEVEGVIVADGGKEQRIKARLGVILNTGGFSRNADMVRSFMCRPCRACLTTAPSWAPMARRGSRATAL